jgi:type I site-specific restriction endonuclease
MQKSPSQESSPQLTEAEIRDRILQVLEKAGWNMETQVRTEVPLTEGKVVVGDEENYRSRGQVADIVLYDSPGLPIAVIEVVDQQQALENGLKKAEKYSRAFHVPWAIATDGIASQSLLIIDEKSTPQQFTGPLLQIQAEELRLAYLDAIKGQIKTRIQLDMLFLSPPLGLPEGDALLPFQRQAIDRVAFRLLQQEQLRETKSRHIAGNHMIVEMASGTGRSIVFANLLWRLRKSTLKQDVLVLVDAIQMRSQWLSYLQEFFGELAGLWEKGTTSFPPITVATVQGVSDLQSIPSDQFDFIVLADSRKPELAASDSVQNILKHFSSADFIAFSSVPLNRPAIGETVFSYTLQDAINDGYAAPYRVIRPFLNDIVKADDELRINQAAGIVTEYLKSSGNRFAKTVVFARDTTNAETFVKRLEGENMDLRAAPATPAQKASPEPYIASIFEGYTDLDLRLDAFRDPDSTRPAIAVNVDQMLHGIDVPTCELIVIDRKLSRTQFLQMLGLGSRISGMHDKYSFTVLDIYGNQELYENTSFQPQPYQIHVQKEDGPLLPDSAPEGPRELIRPETKAHSDTWSKEDHLGYQRYATIIEHIIRDPQTDPPLTVGIIAPWGQGKTTLMHYIQQRFSKNETEDNEAHEKLDAKRIVDWFNREEKLNESLKSTATVWFNPWKYQSSEQIWAGMADAIISQLVGKLNPVRQAEFWLKLQLRRIDKAAIRQDVTKAAITKVLPNAIVFVLSILAILIMLPLVETSVVAMSAGGIGVVAGLWSAGSAYFKWQNEKLKTFEEKLTPYLHNPDYGSKLGAFHHVNEDLQRVFDLLVTEEQPAIIFIDDLDRCSPQKVVEVIEAINLMMSGDFREKCYFILGMDAEMVAASIDVAYEKMRGKIPGKERAFGSVGWYFLDKFIQLPFLIPTLQSEDKKRLIEQFFGKDAVAEAENQTKEASPEMSAQIAGSAMASQAEARQQSQQQTSQVPFPSMMNVDIPAPEDVEKLKTRLEERPVTAPEIVKEVQKFAGFLNASPRSIKRFANLLRFHAALQDLRAGKNIEFADLDTIAVTMIVSLRWPKLVRWLQWHEEECFQLMQGDEVVEKFASKRSREKAQKLDAFFDTVRQTPSFDQALQICQTHVRTNAHLPWLGDPELIKLIRHPNAKSLSFRRAFLCGIW